MRSGHVLMRIEIVYEGERKERMTVAARSMKMEMRLLEKLLSQRTEME